MYMYKYLMVWRLTDYIIGGSSQQQVELFWFSDWWYFLYGILGNVVFTTEHDYA